MVEESRQSDTALGPKRAPSTVAWVSATHQHGLCRVQIEVEAAHERCQLVSIHAAFTALVTCPWSNSGKWGGAGGCETSHRSELGLYGSSVPDRS